MGKPTNNEPREFNIQELVNNLQKLTEIENHQSELQKLLETFATNQHRIGELTISLESQQGGIVDQGLLDEAKKLIKDQELLTKNLRELNQRSGGAINSLKG